MTLKTSSRIAGTMFLAYIVVGITTAVLSRKAQGGAEGTQAILASLVEREPLVRGTALLGFLVFVIAVTLAAALYALTRDLDRDLALVALLCRATEGVLGAIGAVSKLALLAAANESVGAGPDAAAAQAYGAALLRFGGGSTLIAALSFAVASTIYCGLFLRSRRIPVSLAWLGVVSSVLLLFGLPLQIGGLLHGTVTYLIWIPMAVFEVTFAIWLIANGVAPRPIEA